MTPSPKIFGTAERGSIVNLYTGQTVRRPTDCRHRDRRRVRLPGYPGDPVSPNTTTRFYATATVANNTSTCSASSATYIEDSVPPW